MPAPKAPDSPSTPTTHGARRRCKGASNGASLDSPMRASSPMSVASSGDTSPEPSRDRGVDSRHSYQAIVERQGQGFRFSPEFQEQPRQVVFALLLLGGLGILAALTEWGPQYGVIVGPSVYLRMVLVGLLLLLVVYTVLNAPDGLMVRPHPALWRALHGWNLWYCLLLTAILVLPCNDGVAVMGWIFPDVDRTPDKKPAQTLGFDHLTCAVTWTNVRRQFTSIWFMAHVVGWWAKMLIFRDLKICLVYATFFEITELTLQFLVPEFQECWWDSIFLDWGLSNIGGMMLGTITLRMLNLKQYRWASIKERRGLAKVRRLILQLTPYSWSEYQWNPGNAPLTMILNTLIWMITLVAEVNSFFLINILHLPRAHPFNYARQVLLCLTAVPAVSEWYWYTKGRMARIGHSTWLLAVTVSVELLLVVKYSVGLGHVKRAAAPPAIWAPWVAYLLLFSLYFALHCWYFYGANQRPKRLPVWLRLLKWSAYMPFVSLCRLYAF